MNIQKQLIEIAKSVDIVITEEQANAFNIYAETLLEWNEKMNLTAIKDELGIIIKHFIDSIIVLKHVDIKENSKIIDVGTGAGFPGVPMKIMRPDLDITLLDGLNKRLNFLKEVGSKLDLEFTYIHARAEEGGRKKELREKFDHSTARAVANLATLSEYCVPYVKLTGSFIAYKSRSYEEEINEATSAITKLGITDTRIHKYELPDEEKSQRVICELVKGKKTPMIFPRHGNKIKTTPL